MRKGPRVAWSSLPWVGVTLYSVNLLGWPRRMSELIPAHPCEAPVSAPNTCLTPARAQARQPLVTPSA